MTGILPQGAVDFMRFMHDHIGKNHWLGGRLFRMTYALHIKKGLPMHDPDICDKTLNVLELQRKQAVEEECRRQKIPGTYRRAADWISPHHGLVEIDRTTARYAKGEWLVLRIAGLVIA